MLEAGDGDLVVNASPLIFLDACDRMELLRRENMRVVVPAAVVREVTRAPRSRGDRGPVTLPGWVHVAADAPVPESISHWDLGPGESAVLARALANPGSTVVLDDLAARRCARALGLATLGTLGLVLAAKRDGRIASARTMLAELRAAGMWLSDPVTERALALVGEGT